MFRWLPLVLMLISSGARAQGLVINEVLAHPSQVQADCEWVELFNPGSTSVDLQGWEFEGKPLSDAPFILQGEGYLIMARELVDNDSNGISFESVWGDSSGIWGDNSLLENYAAIQLSMVLNDGRDSVSLVSPLGDRQVFHWETTTEGRSWEKVNPLKGDRPENWEICRGLSTPGRRNSWTLAHWDAAIFARNISFSPLFPSTRDSVEVEGFVHNSGDRQLPASILQVYFFEDFDLDSTIDEGEKIAQVGIEGAIAPGDSAEVSSPAGPFSSGSHLICLLVCYPQDEDTSNNLAGRFLEVPFEKASVVVNEIMYDPWEGPEWVEILNIGGTAISLQGWMVGDEVVVSSPLTSPEATLEDEGYAVITSDSLGFRAAYPQVGSPIWEVQGFPSLNNDADMVLISDASGHSVDSFLYSHKWGGDKGISLERINPQLPSSGSANWSSCVAPQGATPGEENSIYAPLLPPKGELSINPNPFSPDGDGRDDRTLISYRLPVETALVTIRVYDLQGRALATIANQEPTGYKGEKIWDGRDSHGKRLSMGLYILYLEALNSSRGVLVNLKKPLVVAGRL